MRGPAKSPGRLLLLPRLWRGTLLPPALYLYNCLFAHRATLASSVDLLPPGGYPTQRALEYPVDMLPNAQPPFWFQPQNNAVPQPDTVYADGRPGGAEPDLHQCASALDARNLKLLSTALERALCACRSRYSLDCPQRTSRV